jgi:pyruvate-formate lyase-activating enzyme
VQLPVAFAGRRWLEIALDYRCNLRCLGCHACHDTGERLTSSEALALLRSGRARGMKSLWLGGGEPTLRDDLLSLVRAARELGYAPITLQTNGMRLAYADYRAAVLRAGVTEVRLNVKSHRAEVHDRLSGGEKCHALLLDALAGLAGTGTRVAADVLLTRETGADLPETISFFASRGVESFVLWLLSAADAPGEQSDEHLAVAAEVPRIADLIPALSAARDAARRLRVELTSLHTPPCTLPPERVSLVRGGRPGQAPLRPGVLTFRGRCVPGRVLVVLPAVALRRPARRLLEIVRRRRVRAHHAIEPDTHGRRVVDADVGARSRGELVDVDRLEDGGLLERVAPAAAERSATQR